MCRCGLRPAIHAGALRLMMSDLPNCGPIELALRNSFCRSTRSMTSHNSRACGVV